MSELSEEAKDLLMDKPSSDISWGGSHNSRSVEMVIIRNKRDSTMRDLRKLRRKIRSFARDMCKLTSFKKGDRRMYVFSAMDLHESEAVLIDEYYKWMVK
jgi:hypothetical protein